MSEQVLTITHVPSLYTISLILHCLRKDTPGQQTGTWNAESSIEKDKQVTPYAASYTPPVPPYF